MTQISYYRREMHTKGNHESVWRSIRVDHGGSHGKVSVKREAKC